MNRKIWRGLAVGAILIVLLAVLYYLWSSGPGKIGPSAVTAPEPPGATAPAKPETPAAPAATQPAPPLEPAGPPQGVAPGPEPKVTVLPPQEGKEQYGILAGSYKKYRDAGKMLARLKQEGKPAFSQRDPRNSNRYQVWLGPFSSQSEAEEAAKSLKAVLKKPLKIEAIENPVPK
jgi:cell division protein FtsN